MIKHAMRAIIVMSSAAMLFGCGTQSAPDKNSPLTGVSSLSFAKAALSLSAVCQSSSDTATVAAGLYHTVGIKKDGTVLAVGSNGKGQLNVSSWTGIKGVAAGYYHTVGLKEDGTVVAVGNNGYGQLDVSSWTGIKSIAAAYNHTVGLKEDGTVVTVGNNSTDKLNVSSWTGIKGIAAGYYHTVGLKEDGTVVAVGNNGDDQLNVSSWTGIKAIAAGAYHTVGLKEDGTVVAVGNNYYGQMDVSSWTGIKAIAAGANHTVGLKEDGTVVAVGDGGYGQLNVFSWTGINAIAAGSYHTVGITDEGTALAVGYNNYLQLEVSTWANMMIASPKDVTAPFTMATITGTMGNNGWYVSDVQLTLTASDEDCGSGVKEIHYTIDGTETVVQASSTTQTITADGTHVVTYYSVDKAGNIELVPQTLNIKIDKMPPSIPSLTAKLLISWPPNHKIIKVLIGGQATDSGSGIASNTITVTDEYGICNLTASHFNSVVSLSSWRAGSDKDGRLYTITAVITDNAGNQSTRTTTVLVPHDMGHHESRGRNDIQDWRPGQLKKQ